MAGDKSSVGEIQPVLDTMTCTKSRCHGANLEHFKVKRAPTDQASLRKNYDVVLAHVNLDFMPFSEVQLRMRQPCAYSIVGAWIEGKPSPVCTVVTPGRKVKSRLIRRFRSSKPARIGRPGGKLGAA